MGIVERGTERWVETRRDRKARPAIPDRQYETDETDENDRYSSAGLTAYRKPETLPALAHNLTWTDFAWQKSNSY